MAVPTRSSQPAARAKRVSPIDRFSVVLVAVAAMLWASDTYFRAQLIGHLKPAQIVVIEDALVSLFLLAFLLRGIPELRRLEADAADDSRAARQRELRSILKVVARSYLREEVDPEVTEEQLRDWLGRLEAA